MDILNSKDNDILNIYPYGSRVYETTNTDSDFDYIIVSNATENPKVQFEENNNNYTIYSSNEFQKQLLEHEISAMECIFLPNNLIIKNKISFDFKVNKHILRGSASKKASNSWVKCKKKLTVSKDYNPYVAKKSLYHSLRILIFAIQIAKFNKIVDYTEANDFYTKIFNKNSNDWNDFKVTFQPIYNKLKSELKKHCPK